MSIDEIFAGVRASIDAGSPREVSALAGDDVPPQKGVYLWYPAGQASPAYIGKATGKAGLRGRIIRQHLNARYLETRAAKVTEKDARQLLLGSVLNGKPAMEKSVFRKHLARRYDLAPGQGIVDFIAANFSVQLIALPTLSDEDVRAVEARLLELFSPMPDVSGNPAARQGSQGQGRNGHCTDNAPLGRSAHSR